MKWRDDQLLVVDSDCLCHRAFYANRELSWKGRPTGAIYGFLRTIVDLIQTFQTNHVALCFDSKVSFRKRIFPGYKAKRQNRPEEVLEAKGELSRQMEILQKKILPKFMDVFCVEGYEADDLLASFAIKKEFRSKFRVTLVTSDQDIYQCLRRHGAVEIYNPMTKKVYQWSDFDRDYGIIPEQWAMVKAIAGCHSDDIPGVGGVGEKTALAYLRDEELTPARERAIICKKGRGIIQFNLGLVKLPLDYSVCDKIPGEISTCNIRGTEWNQICDYYGMHTLRNCF